MILDNDTAVLLITLLLVVTVFLVGWYIIAEIRVIEHKLDDLAVLVTSHKPDVSHETPAPNV